MGEQVRLIAHKKITIPPASKRKRLGEPKGKSSQVSHFRQR